MIEIPLRRSSRQRPYLTYGVAGAIVVAAAIAAASILGGDDPGLSASEPAADVPVVAEFELPADAYYPPAFASGGAWIATDGGYLMRIDVDTNESELVMEGDDQGGATVTSMLGSIWFLHEANGLYRIDPRTSEITTHISEDVDPRAVGFGSLWGMDVGHEVLRVNPDNDQVVARLRVSRNKTATHGCVPPFRATCPDYLTVHEDSVVMFVEGEDTAVHIDPATNRTTKRVKMPPYSSGLYGVNGEDPWMMSDRGLTQVDLDSGNILARIPLEDHERALSYDALFHSIAINGDTAWLVADTTTTEIDLKRGEVVATFDTPGSGGVLAASFGHGDLWVSYSGGTVRRIDLSRF